ECRPERHDRGTDVLPYRAGRAEQPCGQREVGPRGRDPGQRVDHQADADRVTEVALDGQTFAGTGHGVGRVRVPPGVETLNPQGVRPADQLAVGLAEGKRLLTDRGRPL